MSISSPLIFFFFILFGSCCRREKKVEMRKWPAVCIELFAYWTLERHRHISSSSLFTVEGYNPHHHPFIFHLTVYSLGGWERVFTPFFFSCLLWDRETVQWPTLISHPHSACAHGRHPPTPTLAKTMYHPKPLYLVLLSLSLSIYTLFVTFLIRVHSACMLFSHPLFSFSTSLPLSQQEFGPLFSFLKTLLLLIRY